MARIYLGKTIDNGTEDIYWNPKEEKNPHFLVVGTSGSGKTETLKAMVHELSKSGIPVMIIDFHQDFEDIAGNVMDFNNVTINPLEYHPETPEMTMYKVSHILKKIFRLGVQQEGILQDAIQEAYINSNIDLKENELKESPTFDDVKDILERKLYSLKEEKKSTQTLETLLVRLRPLFNTGFFAKKKSMSFSKMFNETTVLKLRDMPTDEVKYAVAEFFLNKLKYELYGRGKTSKLVLYCMIDEAHRLLDEKSPLNDLLRESRKYGTGVILSSQRPSDFSETVLANIGGFITFQCRLDKDAIFMARQMDMNFEEIRSLTEVGTGFLNFSSETGVKKIKIKPLWERTGVKEKTKKKDKPKLKKEEFQEKKPEEIPKEDDKLIKTIPDHEATSPIMIKETPNTDEKIYIDKKRFYFPLFYWLTRGFREYFSNIKYAIAFTIVMGISISIFPLEYSLALIMFFITIMIFLGRRK